MLQWIDPNTITGPPAEGKKYFKRSDIENQIWSAIEKGCHILFLAPRRVGKTSIVMNMAKRPIKYHNAIFENIQSDRTTQDFYKRLYKLTTSILSSLDRTKAFFSTYLNSRDIKKIGKNGVEFERQDIDYKTEFYSLLDSLKRQDERIILILDEFPDVIKNIAETESKGNAKSILEDLRALRQSDEFRSKFTFILLGSVGLHHIVRAIDDRTDKINDLHLINLGELNEHQIDQFYKHVLDEATMQVSPYVRNYLTDSIGKIPYYIQLIIEKSNQKLRKKQEKELTIEIVDECLSELISENNHFQDWENRLTKYFPSRGALLVDILNHCAYHSHITLQEIYDVFRGSDYQNEYLELTEDILIKDGYLHETDTHKYAFNSPLLQAWWARRHPRI